MPRDVAASEGYAISLQRRKRIEEIFGWTKITGGLAQLKVRGLEKVQAVFTFGLVAYNVVRLPKLLRPEAAWALRVDDQRNDQEIAVENLRNTTFKPQNTERAGVAATQARFSAAC